ncbi:hypothetical protein SCLCIDRAFT_27663 [Scleroderma citrinum Foug A]|uniref:Uncharacterized protein n=1 Tax=Scleroderma citrinum Foug A TaxID=1036808 RepID=A0A0C3A2Q1_9AGAM|nr:hypothetical protein SCLCIDRAFT_27663 [Scleroderma citrinum Foug A]
MHSNQMHDQCMPSSISAVTQHAANLSWKTLPERDEWGCFKPRIVPTLPTSGTNTPDTDSNFQLLSELEPQSPPDVASTGGLPPSRPSSPQSLHTNNSIHVLAPPTYQPFLHSSTPYTSRAAPHARRSMADIKPFHGKDSPDENPQDFFKAFNRVMRENPNITSDAEKIEVFDDYLAGGSTAEECLRNEMATDPTCCENNARLQKRITGAGTTHVIWVEEALGLAKLAKIEKSSILIWQVRECLPEVMRDLLDEEHLDREYFTAAVKTLSTVKPKEGRVKTEKRKRDEEAMERRVRASIADITGRMQRTTISQTTTQCTPQPVNTILSTGMCFATQQQQHQRVYNPLELVTEAQKEALCHIINHYEHHPQTAAGQQAHQAQVTQWFAQHGEQTCITESTPYPLMPGTASICSGKCFKCGTHEHGSRDAQSHQETRHALMPKREPGAQYATAS